MALLEDHAIGFEGYGDQISPACYESFGSMDSHLDRKFDIAACGGKEFILVLLGKYFYIMEAVKTFNIPVMLVFICGAAIGITSFSRVLSFALRRFHDITISVLAGFMLGSLNKVWPWKETIETYTDSHGVVKPLVEANIMPNQLVWEAVGLIVLGYAIVYFLEKLSMKTSK